jgi:adenine-specific DNA-methyltransferase
MKRGNTLIKYIGSKRTLVPRIVETVRLLPEVKTVLDLFSGTSRVGHALKSAGYAVSSNDHNAYAACLATCYVQADRDEVLNDAERVIRELNALPGVPGYFTETFCERSRFFMPKNGARVDAMRDHISSLALGRELEAVLLVSLMEAADRVDSTTGLQMAYLKSWAPRAHNDITLRMPAVLSRSPWGKGRAVQLEALEAAKQIVADLTYIDPPYNQHSYLGNYHVWESLVLWDKPEVYGIACKRIDVRERKSAFNSKRGAREAFKDVINATQSRFMIVSFSNEGYHHFDDIVALLKPRGEVAAIEVDFKRYVGAQIGIYNLKGQVVGEVSHLRNKEFIFVVGRDGLPDSLHAETTKQLSLLD